MLGYILLYLLIGFFMCLIYVKNQAKSWHLRFMEQVKFDLLILFLVLFFWPLALDVIFYYKRPDL